MSTHKDVLEVMEQVREQSLAAGGEAVSELQGPDEQDIEVFTEDCRGLMRTRSEE